MRVWRIYYRLTCDNRAVGIRAAAYHYRYIPAAIGITSDFLPLTSDVTVGVDDESRQCLMIADESGRKTGGV